MLRISGIALFTWHKYRKSLESTVPLDAHGNPVTLDDSDAVDGVGAYVELNQTERQDVDESGAISEAVSFISVP